MKTRLRQIINQLICFFKGHQPVTLVGGHAVCIRCGLTQG
jgi:hypothetical protein